MHLSPRRDSPGAAMGQYPKSTSQGMTKVRVCQSKQVSFEPASETIYRLLGSDQDHSFFSSVVCQL